MPQTGMIDKATWYKIKYIYNSVKKVYDLYSGGIKLEEAQIQYDTTLKHGDTRSHVQVLHYYLGIIFFFDDELPLLNINTIYTENTKEMVTTFQKKYNLKATGVVDRVTWNKLQEVYRKTLNHIPEKYKEYKDEIYPGRFLSLGMSGDDVEVLQNYLLKICRKNHDIPGVKLIGVFDELTEKSIKVLEKRFWHEIVELSKE